MAATSTSNFFNTRPDHVGAPSNHGCAKLDGVAMWLINGVANAFFASLQRCSCIRIATVDDLEDSNDDVPLIFDHGNLRHDHKLAAAAGRKRNKGKKTTAFNLLIQKE